MTRPIDEFIANLPLMSDDMLVRQLQVLAEDTDVISDKRKAVRREIARRQREKRT